MIQKMIMNINRLTLYCARCCFVFPPLTKWRSKFVDDKCSSERKLWMKLKKFPWFTTLSFIIRLFASSDDVVLIEVPLTDIFSGPSHRSNNYLLLLLKWEKCYCLYLFDPLFVKVLQEWPKYVFAYRNSLSL